MSPHETSTAFRTYQAQVEAAQAEETRKKQLFDLVWDTFNTEWKKFLQKPEAGVIGEKKLFLNDFIDNSSSMAEMIGTFFRNIELGGQQITVTVNATNIDRINYFQHSENAKKHTLSISIVKKRTWMLNAKAARDINLLIFSDQSNPNLMHVEFAVTPPFFKDKVMTINSPS